MSQIEYNILLSKTHWNWPQAVSGIFQPLGVNALMVSNGDDIVRIAKDKRIHLAIVDSGAPDENDGVQTIKVFRNHFKSLPCILLVNNSHQRLLSEALTLDVFSVLNKPVDLTLLTNQIDRVFQKYYKSSLFSNHQGGEEKSNKSNLLNHLHSKGLGEKFVNWFNK